MPENNNEDLLKSIGETVSSAVQAAVEPLKAQITQLENDVKKANDEASQLKAQQEDLSKENASLKASLDEANKKTAELEQKVIDDEKIKELAARNTNAINAGVENKEEKDEILEEMQKHALEKGSYALKKEGINA